MSTVLILDDPNTVGLDLVVADNGAGYIDPRLGVVTYIGTVGSFIVNASVGNTDPFINVGEIDLFASPEFAGGGHILA